MSMTDPLADMLTRIRNGQQAKLFTIMSPFSKIRQGVLEVLKSEGYIRNYEVLQDGNKSELKIELKYFEGQPVIKKIEKVSKPGRRVYSKIDELKKVLNGLGVSILSTPKGVMSDHDARQQNIGGEVLCYVF
jgi:small subunit ribosomal protein S8